MKLVACTSCHTQYDITDVAAESVRCRCGADVAVVDLESRDLAVHRCSSCGAHVDAGQRECEYCGAGIVTDPRLLSLICPECCARNADAARYCGACGVVFDPQPIGVEKRELPCPVCTSLMPARTVGAIAINECPTCNGIWCPAQGFEALVKAALESKKSSVTGEVEFVPRAKGSNPASQRIAYRKCPECDAFMLRRNFRKASGVIIDRCNSHGTWLDADELEQIAGYLLSGGRPNAERYMRETDAQADAEYRAARKARIAAESGANRQVVDAVLRSSTRRGESFLGSSLVDFLTSLID
ncbi:MAG: zf-TFIIB domain-containing protein [Myxococcota bacterium]|nr:zf-TFIIB domain-containing protein [Myxococcales bacterium]